MLQLIQKKAERRSGRRQYLTRHSLSVAEPSIGDAGGAWDVGGKECGLRQD